MCFFSGFSSILSGCHYCPNMLGHLCPDCFRSFIIWFYMCVKVLTYKTCLLYYTAKIFEFFFKKMLWFFYFKTSCLIQCAIFLFFCEIYKQFLSEYCFKKISVHMGLPLAYVDRHDAQSDFFH